jgi:hypothetical protein
MNITVRNKRTWSGEGEYIGRGNVLGNPFRMRNEEEREFVIKQYRQWLWNKIRDKDIKVHKELDRLLDVYRSRGELNLICWCAPKQCHGDIIRSCLIWWAGIKAIL